MASPDSHTFADAPPVFFINLDRAADRRSHMERQFAEWGVAATRVAAVDGAAEAPGDFLTGGWPEGLSAARLACYASHVSALEAFLADGAARGVIMEDDCSFETVAYWPFTWAEAEARLPFDADIVQLSLISDASMTMRLHRRLITNYSAAAYLVTRRYAEKLMGLYTSNGAPCFDRAFKPELTSEIMLFEPGSAYTLPVFSYETSFASHLRDGHVERLHRPCREIGLRFWRDVAPELDDWRVLFDYDPAFGRMAPRREKTSQAARTPRALH